MRSLVLFFIICIGFVSSLHAQTTGKVAGKITDVNGEPLPGVNIIIDGSSRGSASDFEGNYFILSISPGIYSITASMVGFQKVQITEVRVQVDRTTTLDFKMEEEAFEGQEIVVTATQEMVIKDKTSSSAKVSGDEILALPADSFVKSIGVQAGVSRGSGGSLHIRGGRSSEIKYYVDGVAISNPFNNSLATPVENTAVQEVEVISGTYNAEFGQANSGIVNIVTKDGADFYSGTFISSVGGYFSNNTDIFYEIDKAPILGEQVYEASLSGPILKNRLSFFTNLKYTNRDGWLFGREVFLPSDSSNFSSTDFNQWDIQANGDSTIQHMNTSSGLGGLFKLTLKATSNIKISYSLNANNFESTYYTQRYRLNPGFQPTQYSNSFNHLIAINHVLDQRTFYNIRLTKYTTDFSQYVYENPFDEGYKVINGRSNQPGDVFNTGGVNNYHLFRNSDTYAFRFDITRQFGNTHLVKAGVEYRHNRLNLEEYSIQALRQNNLEREIPPLTSTLHNQYERTPVEAAFFIQDKIEIKDLIINIGLRYDYFDPNGKVPVDLRNPGGELTDASVKSQFSPRIGFAFPISENGVIHASYGQFFQIPEYERLYVNPENEVIGSNFSNYIGNPDLDAQRSTTYEIGLSQQINDFIAIDVTTYYRDLRGLVGTRLYEARTGGDTWGRFENTDFGRVRGITLSTSIRSDFGLNGSINYTLQSARGNASDPLQAFLDAQNNNEANRNMLPLSWDQGHNVSGTLTYAADVFTAGLIGTFHTGYPFTPVDLNRQSIVELRNVSRFESEFTLDLRLAYLIKINKVVGQLFLQGENILDFYRKDRFPRIYPFEIDIHNSTGRNQINSIQDYRRSPLVQIAPRSIRAGFQFNF